ncbi:MAG: metallophosphoesterase [Candidatus Acidiferrales bacterium]
MRRSRTAFVVVVQSILLVAHLLVYETWMVFAAPVDPPGGPVLAIALGLLSVSFVIASLLAFRYYNLFVRAFYTLAAVWLGILNFCFFASLACWIAYAGTSLVGLHWERREIALGMFGLAVAAGLAGIANASWIRVKRIRVRLPDLPEVWRGRVAAFVSDMHLGPVRGYAFSKRIVALLNGFKPDVVFMTGDVYDGTAADVNLLAKPFADLSAPLGRYFVAGNHEEFSNRVKYLEALELSGVRVLEGEKVTVDGLQIVGVPYHDLTTPERFQSALRQADLKRDDPSILLAHAPNRLWEAEAAGVTLQLCGHTHGGQFFPWTAVVSRIYGKFAYGLQRLGAMTVYTTCGAGTWGPPVRLGTNPEVVLIHFE